MDTNRRLPETPFGVRLKAARKMAGMSMEDLAQKLGGLVTKQAIGKYEKGQMMPSPEVFERLVEVLKITTWGASPLKAEDALLEREMTLMEGSMPLGEPSEPVGQARMAFRRQGLLRRLIGAREKEGAKAIEHAEEESEMSFSLLCREAPLPKSERVEAFFVSDVAPSLRSEAAFPALADRRTRYLDRWRSDAAMNEIRFRAGERLSAKTESALKYRIADHLQKYLELESVLGAPAAFENPVSNVTVGTSPEVETAASEVRRRWELGAGPIVNLLGLLEDKGIKVYETRGIEGFEGLSGRFGNYPFIAVSMEYPADRIRFTAAHELGHVMCDFSANESPESVCHAFGAAFLLPKAALEKTFTTSRRKVTMGDLGEIKETYGISLQAIMYRAHALGFVSDRQFRSFRETIKAKGWVVEEPVAYTGKERATRFRRLLHYAVAAEILDVERAAEMAGVPAEELRKEIGEIF
jgi:Zn-dependent peptidase ImmA (M78 family)/transcriptional regulator with XRE-family HTH domain